MIPDDIMRQAKALLFDLETLGVDDLEEEGY
jgi:hypothetical protein